MEQTPSSPQPPEPPSLPSSSTFSPSPNPNPTPRPLTPLQPYQQHPMQNSQSRPPFNRPWQQPSHFASHSSSLSSPSSLSPDISVQRGAGTIAIGVPANHPTPPLSQPLPFSSLNQTSFGQQFGALGRKPATMPDSVANSSTSQLGQPSQGYQGMGMVGSSLLLRPGMGPTYNPSRPGQPSVRPQSTMNQSISNQNFQGHGLLRASSMGSLNSPSPNASQTTTSHNQPWLSSGTQTKPSLTSPSSSSIQQGKPPLPSPSFRPQINSQSMQQRSHIPQQHQQISPSFQPENPGKQTAPFRAPQILPITRVQGAANQKPSSLPMIQQLSMSQIGIQGNSVKPESDESSCNRIIRKRSIHELVNQIDPSEKLDPEVEDILVDIAEDFVESITTFGCSLAKHRKSSTLEAKDILLHVERNWNMTLPGFSGQEIKTYKKPIANDTHKERLVAIKKSTVGSDATNTKNSGVGSAKSNLAKSANGAAIMES